jgi:hypothetical protein
MANRREAKTVPVHELPTVLIIGCSREFVERCREGAAKMGAIVRTSEPATVEAMASTCKPLALVLTEAAYRSASATYDALAERVQSKLVTVADEGVAREELEALVVEAVSHVRRMRSSIPPS